MEENKKDKQETVEGQLKSDIVSVEEKMPTNIQEFLQELIDGQHGELKGEFISRIQNQAKKLLKSQFKSKDYLPIEERQTKVSNELFRMMECDKELYGKITGNSAFAHHFNKICKLAVYTSLPVEDGKIQKAISLVRDKINNYCSDNLIH
ncbi:MAG: hypothetical protein JWO92_2529 [Chitinophagaceae bacterium]|nr:hypothetical protein [Chitinophagaceae bacterium]